MTIHIGIAEDNVRYGKRAIERIIVNVNKLLRYGDVATVVRSGPATNDPQTKISTLEQFVKVGGDVQIVIVFHENFRY